MDMVGDHESSDDREVLQREGRRWMVRLSSGAATAADARALEAWRAESPDHDEAFRHAARIWVQSGDVLESYRPKRPSRSVLMNRRALLVGTGAVAAASGLAIHSPPFDLWPSFASLNADYRTSAGERRSIDIASGLRADLNTRTSLDLSRSDGLAVRLIEGEAVLSADLGRKTFQAFAGPATVTSSFGEIALRLTNNEGTVACLAGSAAIDCLGQSVTLKGGQAIGFSNAGFAPLRSIDLATTAIWRTGTLVFRGETMNSVVAELNRYRTSPIILANRALGQRRVSGVFHVDRSEEVIDHIRSVYGVTVRRMPGGVLILA